MKFGEGVATHVYYKLHQVSSKPDEKQKSFINRPFFCSEFQSVSRIVKIVHRGAFTYYVSTLGGKGVRKMLQSLLK